MQKYTKNLDSDNVEFIGKLEYKDYRALYHIEKSGGDENKPIYYSYLVDDKKRINRKILKMISLEDKDREYLNMVIDGIKSSSILTYEKEYVENRYLRYNDIFLSKFNDQVVLCYVYDMIKGEDLFDWLCRFQYSSDYRNFNNFISLECLVNITYSIFTSLAILHLGGVIHRDIKLENIIIENPNLKEGYPKLKFIDFDYSCDHRCQELYSYPGTEMYMPISIFIGRMENIKISPEEWKYCDIASASITILRLYSRTNKKTWDMTEMEYSKEFSRDLERETIFRQKHLKNFEEREKDFIQTIIDCSCADIYKHITAVEINKYLESEYKDIISRELLDSYKKDLKRYNFIFTDNDIAQEEWNNLPSTPKIFN